MHKIKTTSVELKGLLVSKTRPIDPMKRQAQWQIEKRPKARNREYNQLDVEKNCKRIGT